MKEKIKKILKGENGITLVALVVTIVVLLILAGVSLNLVVGPNGIVSKAKEASNKMAEAQHNDQLALNEMEGWLNKLLGDNSSSTEEPEPEKPVTDLSKLQIGDYVNYTYDVVSDYLLKSEVSGYSGKTVSQPQIALKWRILNINKDGSVDLVSEIPTDSKVYFQGALGYNNGVYALHDICATLFSNKKLGAIARSINLEDIEKQETEAGTVARKAYEYYGVQYGNSKTHSKNNSYYPNLYEYQKGSGIDTTTIKTNGISESDTTAKEFEIPTTKEYSQASELTATQTAYSNTFNDTNYGIAGTVLNSSKTYWVASRCSLVAGENLDFTRFSLRQADSRLIYCAMFDSYEYTFSGVNGNYLRPVVSLSSNLIDLEAGKNAGGEWQIK